MGLNGGYCCFWWEKPAALGFLRAQDECTGLPPSRLGGGSPLPVSPSVGGKDISGYCPSQDFRLVYSPQSRASGYTGSPSHT